MLAKQKKGLLLLNEGKRLGIFMFYTLLSLILTLLSLRFLKKSINVTKGVCVHKTLTKVKIYNRSKVRRERGHVHVPAHNAKYQIYHNVNFFLFPQP